MTCPKHVDRPWYGVPRQIALDRERMGASLDSELRRLKGQPAECRPFIPSSV